MVSVVPKPQVAATWSIESAGLLEAASGGLEPHLLDVAGRGDADPFGEHPGQVAGAHGGPARPGPRPSSRLPG